MDRKPPASVESDLYKNVDPLKENYRERLVQDPEAQLAIRAEKVALLSIDIQYLDAARGEGIFSDLKTPDLAQEYYFNRLETEVLANVSRLQASFRRQGLEVIHTRIQSLTADGRDRSPGHKRLGLAAAPGSKEAEFLPEVAPLGDEIVINKTASGVFSVTNIEYVLRNLGINSLFMVGVYTDECVSTAVRDACDLGFFVTLIHDATATVTEDRQNSTVLTLNNRYCRVLSTNEAIAELESLAIPADTATV